MNEPRFIIVGKATINLTKVLFAEYTPPETTGKPGREETTEGSFLVQFEDYYIEFSGDNVNKARDEFNEKSGAI